MRWGFIMKLFKFILLGIMSTLLVMSIILNVLFFCGFVFTRKTVDTSIDVTTAVIEDDVDIDYQQTTKFDKPGKECSKNTSGNKPACNSCLTNKVIYKDENIIISYISTKEGASEVIHQFRIENLSNKALDISFTDVTADGRRLYISGLTCEKLLPNDDRIEDFILTDKDWEYFPKDITNVSFTVTLMNARSHLTWYQTDLIYMTF
jgi:hypothetical protein